MGHFLLSERGMLAFQSEHNKKMQLGEALHLIFLMETTRCLSEAKTIPPSPHIVAGPHFGLSETNPIIRGFRVPLSFYLQIESGQPL